MLEYFSDIVECPNCGHEQEVRFISDDGFVEPIAGQHCDNCDNEFVDDGDELND